MTFFESGPVRPASGGYASSGARPPRRRMPHGVVAGVVLAVVSAGLFTAVTIAGPERVAASAQRVFGGVPEPAPEIVELADQAYLTDEGRQLLYASRPQLAPPAEVEEMCGKSEDDDPDLMVTGCYSSLGFILIADEYDPSLVGSLVTTLAHELLHAAYDELDAGEAGQIDALLHTAYADIPPTDPILEQISGSVGAHDASLDTELFAYLGSQVMPSSGLAPELEAVYARYFTDRAALVSTYTG
ncbi:hypothetical protein [Microbacterium terricola]|uniref:Uncharacterized protein n=1 Tax=Microbacterium terricola TaxID=344163 RepID=A0ABM8E2P9_9MICO|nr:hypothetical protein [Microbacterium terricola]UYK40296.1 hypothetical protein OAU46_01190 [Microbacterium terricola]BDV31991.1 hypothetical protein Microterr_26510 [Microbacterium terricola]